METIKDQRVFSCIDRIMYLWQRIENNYCGQYWLQAKFLQAAVFPTAIFIILKPIVRNSISLPYNFLNSVCLNIQYLLEASGLVV